MDQQPLGFEQFAQRRHAPKRRAAGEQFDQHVAQAGQVAARRAIAAFEHLGRRIGGSASALDRRVVQFEGRSHVDDLGVARPLEHDVRRLDVAMHDFLAVQRGQRRQTFPYDRHGHTRLQPGLHGAGRHDNVVQIIPAAVAHPVARPFEHLTGQQPAQVVAVDPFHLHDADAIPIDEILHVEQVVLLDLGDPGRRFGNPGHGFVVAADVVVACRREDLQGDRQREVVGAAALGLGRRRPGRRPPGGASGASVRSSSSAAR